MIDNSKRTGAAVEALPVPALARPKTGEDLGFLCGVPTRLLTHFDIQASPSESGSIGIHHRAWRHGRFQAMGSDSQGAGSY
jgi:hypothetical protein